MNITHALREFGARHGQEHLSLPAGGSVSIDLPDLPLTIEESGETVLMLTGFPAPFLEAQRMIAMLQRCEQRNARPDEPALQLGTRGKMSDLWVIAVLRWPQASVSAQQLEQGAGQLHRFLKEWAS